MASQEFDWYISPAERFAAETQFAKYSQDEDEVARKYIVHARPLYFLCAHLYPTLLIPVTQLEQLFQLSRLSQPEFSQIWQIVDIRMTQRINLEQFVYFSHVLNQRRKGKEIPVGIPLTVKESFLKESTLSSSTSARPSAAVRDVGASHAKTTRELEDELDRISTEVRLARGEEDHARDHLKELEATRGEVQGLADYKRKEAAALKDLPQSSSPGGPTVGGTEVVDELLEKLKAERDMLVSQQRELQTAIGSM
ncbi:endocytosis defective- protein [Thoreauomyces humboldtii]|nr:endocytosis defective- protein [Thoreauomyces humboldtii]